MRLGMQIAFGCVHRKTASTGLGYSAHNSFLKLTPIGTPQNCTIRVNLRNNLHAECPGPVGAVS